MIRTRPGPGVVESRTPLLKKGVEKHGRDGTYRIYHRFLPQKKKKGKIEKITFYSVLKFFSLFTHRIML